jgi:8-oxo-dGTP pyrophosphatase MutT (NUDIX family)
MSTTTTTTTTTTTKSDDNDVNVNYDVKASSSLLQPWKASFTDRRALEDASFQSFVIEFNATGGMKATTTATTSTTTYGRIICVASSPRVSPMAQRMAVNETWEAKMEERWNARVVRGADAPRALFNGLKFRYVSAEVLDARDGCVKNEVVSAWGHTAENIEVRVRLGLCDYKTFCETNLASDWMDLLSLAARDDPAVADDAEANTIPESRMFKYFADALGNCVALRTADDKFIALRRSAHLSEAPGAVAFPGGHGEPSAVGFDVDTAHELDVSELMFDAALDELEEELGISREDVHSCVCLGVTRRVVNARACMVFYAETALLADDVLKSYPHARDAYESANAFAVSLHDLESTICPDMPGDHVGAVRLLLDHLSPRAVTDSTS